MSKEELLKILQFSEENNISEKEACLQLIGKCIKLSYYKNKYGIKVNEYGKAKFTARIKRQLSVNDNYFSTFTEENCYYAGFIAADGNISKNNKKLTIGLTEKDSYFLQTFLDKLNSDYKIYPGTKDIYKYSSITIVSEQICQDLYNNFNIYPNKSLSLVPPNLSESFLDCFIMGLIDGDGTIGFTKRKNKQDGLYISIVGTKEMVKLVQTSFNTILGKTSSNLYQRDKNKNFYSYRICDKNARIIFCYFYEKYNHLPVLTRKWSKEHYNYCINYKKALPISRRKGVNIFNLKGELVKTCSTLLEAEEFTGTSFTTISKLCKINDNRHMSNGYMFSRNVKLMKSYVPSKSINTKFLDKEGKELDKGESNIEDEN